MIMYIIIYCLVCLLITLICTYYSYQTRFIPGPIGPIGDQGQTGFQGQQGLKGPKGRMGDQGMRGYRGTNNGIQGKQGIDGYVGEKGAKGLQGYSGFKGKQGLNGERGMKGIQGRQGFPGFDGETGNAGEYDLTLIDESSCRYMPFNKSTRTCKCPFNYVLTGIKNDKNDYQGFCCKIKVNENCRGLPLGRKLLDHKPVMVGTAEEYKFRTVEQQEEFNKYKERYSVHGEGNLPLFYKKNYVCEEGTEPKIKGSESIRCCKPEETDTTLKYLKYY
jgi:hypothetical protein